MLCFRSLDRPTCPGLKEPYETEIARSWLSSLGLAALFIAGAASAAEIHVMISAGFYRVYAELGPAFERASGHRLVTTRGPSMGDSPEAIPTRLARGETADVVILDGGAADELGRRGLLRAGSKVEFARSQIGMVVRAGAAKPDISSVEAFRSTLLAAKSIAYFGQWQRHLSIDHAVPEARHRRPGGGQESKGARAAVRRAGSRGRRARRGGDRLPAGERADTRSGVTFVGPLPAELQPDSLSRARSPRRSGNRKRPVL